MARRSKEHEHIRFEHMVIKGKPRYWWECHHPDHSRPATGQGLSDMETTTAKASRHYKTAHAGR